MRIDSHQHFWKYDPIRDSWIDETMKVIRKDFIPKDLKPILEENAIDGSIVIQADSSEEETEFLLKCAKENSFVKGVVGWVNLRADNIEDRLSHFSENPLLKGIRHIVQTEAKDFMLDAHFQNGISKLEKFNLAYDILIFPKQLPASIELVKKFPNQRFVLDHLAKPYIKKGKINSWKKNINLLAKYENVYCKVSGMFTEADWKNWKEKDFKPFLDTVFDAFGIDRVMYGSDWPVCLLATNYKQQLSILNKYIEKLSIEEKNKIMGLNTIDFYKTK